MRIAFLLCGTLLLACYGEHGGPGAFEEGEEPFEEGYPDQEDPPAVDPVEPADLAEDPADLDTCRGGAELDFVMRGSGLEAWEGARVGASALENDWDDDPLTATRRVHLSGAIVNGAFALTCEDSLSENYAYPSYALYVDVDGDGRCSAGDLAYNQQLYGWNSSIVEDLDAADLYPVQESFGAPIGSQARDFCGGYFE
jgi:hypothetical protein